MLELPSHAISDRHARGLRRDSERRIRDRRQSYRLERRPRKFGPRVRMVHELLYGTLGPGRVMMIEGTKRFAMWTVCDLNSAGVYQLRGEILRKRGGEVIEETHEFPVVATPHFYERLIQGFRYEGHTLITTLIEIVRLLMSEVGIDDAAPTEHWPTWNRCGNVWFALDYGLAAGDIPRHGEVVLRTIMPIASLHRSRFEDWQAMRDAGRYVSVSAPSMPMQSADPRNARQRVAQLAPSALLR